MQRKHLSILYLCLFLSGGAGLAYEVLWARLLGLFFGHTVYAVTTVLAAFMGGLALGSWLIGRWADRTAQPLRLYGMLEVGIGLSCLAIPSLLDLTRSAYLHLHPLLEEETALKTLLQFLLSFTVLLVPTILMGGTLPAVVKGTATRRERTGRNVAALYGTNTIGAAAGALAAGFWLLPAIGIRNTNLLGVACNLAAGVLVLGMLRTTAVRQPQGATPSAPVRSRTALERALLGGFVLSGTVSMAYQVAWVRSLVLVIGSSTYAFSSIVVTFLLGLALGSYLFTLIPKGEKPSFFAALQLAIAAAAFLLIPFFNYLPQAFLLLFRGHDPSFGYILLTQVLLVFPFVLVPTVFMGMTFPCVAGMLTRKVGSVGSDVGRLYAWNTLGAIAGSVGAGFLLIPALGAQRTISLGIGINVSVAIVVLALAHPRLRLSLAVGALPVAGLLVLFPSWNRKAMVSEVAARPDLYLGEDGSLRRDALYEDLEILYLREGISSTVAVVRQPGGNTALIIDGKSQASLTDMETNVKLAYLPLIFHPEPRTVAVIGLGSGVTAGTASLFDSVERIDVVELNEAVAAAPPFFQNQNFSVLEDSRLDLHIDDGRSFLAGTERSYDVIISEPSHLWIAGVANLFTEEFMSLAKSRLAADGIFCQWLQGYSLTPDIFKTVIRTFRKVFPDAALWQISSSSYLLTGTQGGLKGISLEDLEKRIGQNPRLAAAFAGSFRDDPLWTIFRSFRLDGEALEGFVGDGPVNGDDRNRVEFEAPKAIYRLGYRSIASEVDAARGRMSPALVEDRPLEQRGTVLLFARYLMGRDLFREASRVFGRIPSLAPPLPEGENILTLEGTAPFRTDFSPPPSFPLLPQLGFFRPDGDEAREAWKAYLSHFTRISGIVPDEGLDGGWALQVEGLEGIRHVSYFLPLALEPSTRYRVTLALRSDMEAGGEGGVGVLEYGTLSPPERQPSRAFNSTHRIRGQDTLRIRGPLPAWKRRSFSFLAGPSAKMAFVVFYREGAMDAGRIFFDDLAIEKVPEGHREK